MYFMSWYHGPTTAVLHDLTPQRAHATAIGVYMFCTQLLGALGPLLIGRISDVSDLQIGLQVATAVMVFGALLLLLVIYFIKRDGLHHPRLAALRAEDEAYAAAHLSSKNDRLAPALQPGQVSTENLE